ncbi:hypothetical protein AB0395_32750 [Streptosporangium sp. NPDC051023]|uniref:hypothetical protein n=1 Tax=Streptosporangium sp. NPDC051023 TaxID=3155410 RepID=UPI00344EA58D
MTTIIPDFGLAAYLDRQTTTPPAPAIATAQEIVAQTARLVSLPIAAADRREVLGLLQQAGQHLFDIAFGVSLQADAEAPAGATLDDQPWGRLVDGASEAGLAFAAGRDHLAGAITAVDDLAVEQARQAAQDGGEK